MTATPFDLTGKRAFVTGAGQGIGRACAEALRDAGADVLAADLREDTRATLTGCETLSLDDRLLAPSIDGRRASWDTALDLVATRFSATIATACSPSR